MKKLALTIGALAMLGCGGGNSGGIDEGPSAQEGTAEPSAINATVTEADGLNSALSAQNGEALAGAAVGLSGAAMEAVRPASGQKLTIQDAMTRTIADNTNTTGTKNCTPTGCTFDNFGDGNFTVSGSVTASDGMNGAKHIVWALSGKATDLGGSSQQVENLNFTFSWKGDLNASATSLDGAAGATWSGSGTAQGQSFSFDYGSIIKFQAITLANHCATGGSVFAKWWVSAQSGGQSQNQAYQATHTFNGCQR
jgi:hypothetical protein